MNEFCAGVKILLERMKSNPEDFEVIDFNAATYKSIDGRFYDFAKLLAKVISCDDDKAISWQEWRYFTEEERQALVAGFTEMQRAKFDKEIMERVFDDQYIERQRKEHQSHVTLQTQMQTAQIRAQTAQAFHAAQVQGQAHLAISAQQGGTGFSGGGLMNAMGLGNIFK
jgi:hypothetical protein